MKIVMEKYMENNARCYKEIAENKFNQDDREFVLEVGSHNGNIFSNSFTSITSTEALRIIEQSLADGYKIVDLK